MDPITLATLILTAVVKAADLANQAITASKAGDDNAALALLDQAFLRYDADSALVRQQLDAVKADVAAAIAAKFPTT